jgi:predicted enzyme related to lactoylglutathione lyase
MKATITTIMINTKNPERLTDFWSKLLGVGVKYQTGNYTWLKTGKDNGVAIGFQKVDQLQKQPMVIHVDIAVDDKAKVTEYVEKLGGSLVKKQGFNNIVADPDGNQFCVYVQET